MLLSFHMAFLSYNYLLTETSSFGLQILSSPQSNRMCAYAKIKSIFIYLCITYQLIKEPATLFSSSTNTYMTWSSFITLNLFILSFCKQVKTFLFTNKSRNCILKSRNRSYEICRDKWLKHIKQHSVRNGKNTPIL